MKRAIVMLALGAAVTSVGSVATVEGGVDPLRGRWDLTAELPDAGSVELRLYVVDVAPDPSEEGAFLAGGCVETVATGTTTPAAMRSVGQGDGTAAVTVFSTLVPDGFDPIVAALDGTIDFGGPGVSDDTVAGAIASDLGEGTWSGVHHDRRRPTCPAVDLDELSFSGDAYTAQDAQVPPNGGLILEGFTQIVSSGMLVESASIGSVVAPPFTDIFSPGVDFVSEFRYLASFDGLPPAGEVVSFSLLDVFGQPIPGATSTDVWNGCFQGAPGNVQGSYAFEQHIDLSWDPVAPAPGFDPGSGIGFYQIESDGGYGGVTDGTTSHLVPWAPFGGEAPGVPDGWDFGASLSEFGDGVFGFSVISFAEDVGPGGVGLACQVRDEPLYVEIVGNDVTVGVPAPAG